jgi:hypothetical protein
MNLYATVFDIQRNPTGLELGSLIGNVARLSSAVIVGATSLSVMPITTVALAINDRITIFDGSSSEVVSVASTVAIGQASIPLLVGTQYAHVQYTALCSDGVMGSLADQVVDASAELENYLQQSLFQATYTETLRMPSMRASIDNEGLLVFRPRHFPVMADTGISIARSNAQTLTYDASQAIIDGGQQVVSVPWLVVGSGGGSTYSIMPTISRSASLYLTITYTAGYPAASMPGDVREACVLLTCDILAKRLNPLGAADIQSGDRRVSSVLRGDNSGESLLFKRAAKILDTYSIQSF